MRFKSMYAGNSEGRRSTQIAAEMRGPLVLLDLAFMCGNGSLNPVPLAPPRLNNNRFAVRANPVTCRQEFLWRLRHNTAKAGWGTRIRT